MRRRVRSAVIHIYKATEIVLAPAVTVEQDRIPFALRHQIHQLAAAVGVDGPSRRNALQKPLGGQLPAQAHWRARLMTAAPTAANWVPAPVLLLKQVI